MIAKADPFGEFLLHATRARRLPFVPEVQAHVADNLDELWSSRDEWRGRTGGTAPYWGIAWPGGLALSRMILDRPELVRGRSVLDVGAGSGICAIAALLAGAREAIAFDIDPDACQAICRNAALNSVSVSVSCSDPIDQDHPAEVLLAADLWYEVFLARRATRWLRQAACAGKSVYLADPGRSYAPREGIEVLAQYGISPVRGLEQADIIQVRTFRIRP